MIMIHKLEESGKFQAECTECGAIGHAVDEESIADDMGYAHQSTHIDTEEDTSI